jgi:hypothetical protein
MPFWTPRDLDFVKVDVTAFDGEETLEDALLGGEHQPLPRQAVRAAVFDPISLAGGEHLVHDFFGQGLRRLGVEAQTGDGNRILSCHGGRAVAGAMGDAADEPGGPEGLTVSPDGDRGGGTTESCQGRARSFCLC